MSREILFRGKRIDNGEWVYGYYLIAGGMPFISTFGEKEPIAVIPETVGQFTGLYDKNGVEIYEGDRIHWGDTYGAVIFYQGSWCYIQDGSSELDYDLLNYYAKQYFEVIGNIHEEERKC